MMLLILDIVSQNKYLSFIINTNTSKAMLQLLQNIRSKLDAFVDRAIELVRPKKQKWDYQKNIIIKNKWQIRLEKQRQRQQQKERKESEQLQRLNAGLNKLSSKERERMANRIQAIRAQMCVNKKTMQKIEKKQFEVLVKSIGPADTSFLLPTFITFTDQFWLNEDSLRIIYNMIQTKLQADGNPKQSAQVECVEISSLDEATEPSVPIFKGKIRLFHQSLNLPKDILQKFVKRMEAELSSSTVVIEDEKQQLGMLDELRKGEIQHILKQLRKAKIYRYELNEPLHSLIGRYLMLKQEEPSEWQQQQGSLLEQFQLSDIGLFSESIRVGANQQREIMQYWRNRINQSACGIHSRFIRYEEKIIRQLNIKEQSIIDVKSYFQVLTKFQLRLIQVEEEKSRHQVSSKRKELADVCSRFERLWAESHVVKDNMWTGVTKDLPIATFSNSTTLRIFKKWRSFDCSDNLSASKIISRLVAGELKVYEAFELLLNDYDIQLIIPRNRYISQLIDAIASYKELTNQLIAEERAYRKIEAIKESITFRERYRRQDKIKRQALEKTGGGSDKCIEFDSEDFQLSLDEEQEEYQGSSSDEDSSDSGCQIIMNANRRNDKYGTSQPAESESESQLDVLQLESEDADSYDAQIDENEDQMSINENLQSQSQEGIRRMQNRVNGGLQCDQ